MEGIMQIAFEDIVPSHDYDEKIFQYFNPRLLVNSKNDNSYASQSITELKDSIRMFGLQQMFIINRVDNKNYLLDGHRRREAISQLIKEDALCFNEKLKSWIKASVLYGTINVQFHENLHTADAFSKVFCIDNNKIVFDDNVIIKFIDYCNQANIAKENIAKMCHKPIPYVKQVLSILSGLEDDDTLKEQLFEGKIVLSAAEDLVEEFPDTNDRNDIIEQAWDYAEERAKRKIQKIDDSILTAVVKLNKAKQAKSDLVASGSFSEILTLIKKSVNICKKYRNAKNNVKGKHLLLIRKILNMPQKLKEKLQNLLVQNQKLQKFHQNKLFHGMMLLKSVPRMEILLIMAITFHLLLTCFLMI